MYIRLNARMNLMKYLWFEVFEKKPRSDRKHICQKRDGIALEQAKFVNFENRRENDSPV